MGIGGDIPVELISSLWEWGLGVTFLWNSSRAFGAVSFFFITSPFSLASKSRVMEWFGLEVS